MRILLAIHPSGNFELKNSLTWYHNLFEPLHESGHEVTLFRLDEFAASRNIRFRSKKFKSAFSQTLPDFISKKGGRTSFDFILTYLTDLDISIEAIRELQEYQIPMANFSCNNTHQFHLVKGISPHFTYALHSEKNARDKLLEIGANPVHFQMAANPLHYRKFRTDFIYNTSFVGMNYARRLHYIEYLLKNKFPVHCFGPKWVLSQHEAAKKKLKELYYTGLNRTTFSRVEKDYRNRWISIARDYRSFAREFNTFLHPSPSDSEVIMIYNQTRINLGFLEVYQDDNRPDSDLVKHLHLREFEIPMSGGLYLTNYSEELAENYEPHKEILVYSDEMELKNKIEYYISHPGEAERVRMAGYQRAQRCHTWQHRFEKFFRENPIKT